MSSSNFNNLNQILTTGAIIGIVIGATFGLILLIACIAIIVCLIKHCNRRQHPAMQGMVLQPYQQQHQQMYPYPHALATEFPPHITSVAHYPMPQQPVAPPYNAYSSDYTKPPMY